jgi:hypothetical protein
MGEGITPDGESIEEGLERIRRQNADATGGGPATAPQPLPSTPWSGTAEGVPSPVVGRAPVPGPRPGDDLLPSYAVVLAWTRMFAAVVGAFVATSVSRLFGFGLITVVVLVLAAVVVVRSILRVLAAPHERAWGSSAGLHVVERRTERVIPWPSLVRAESVSPSGQSRSARVVLHLDDGSRVVPRQWNGIGVSQADTVVSRIVGCRQRFQGHG